MNVIDLLRAKNIEPRKASGTHGAEYHSPCPGCGGNDRFHVWTEQNDGNGSFWCRGCGKGGDGIQFLIEFDGKTYPEACAALGREADSVPHRLSSPNRPPQRTWAPEIISDPTSVDVVLWRQKAEKFVHWAHEELLKNPGALSFLAKRGISEKTAELFMLGLNPGENGKTAVFRPRKAWGLPEELKDGKEKRLWLPRGLVVPYFTKDGVVRIRIRRPDADLTGEFKQRYFVVPGSRMDRTVCGEGNRKAAVIVETEMDAMMIHQAAGDLVTAVAMGTSHAKPDSACHEALKNTLSILVALDFDKAGESAWKWWKENYNRSERWPVPIGKDPGDAFKEGVDIRLWILAGLPPVITQAIAPKKNEKVRVDTEKQKEPEQPAPVETQKAPEDGPVSALRKLIKMYPFSIENSKNRLRIIENKDWASKNWEISKKISQLVFSNEVGVFLASHPEQRITRNNFDRGLAH